jgi:membrane protein
LISLVRRVVSRLQGVGVSGTAANLAFTTLLALVPLATVTFAVVAQFPMFRDALGTFEEWVASVLLPGIGHGAVRGAIVGFAEQASRLQAINVAFLAVTAALLVATIEGEFNAIFGVRRRRPFVRRLTMIVVGVTLGPIAAGLSVSATTWLVAQSLDIVPVGPTNARAAGALLPGAIGVVAFTLAYKVLPYCRVRWRHALLGGVLASAGIEVAKSVFAWYVVNFPTYREIYGALAVLPLFMLWIYVCWYVVLVGAAIVAALTPGNPRGEDR